MNRLLLLEINEYSLNTRTVIELHVTYSVEMAVEGDQINT